MTVNFIQAKRPLTDKQSSPFQKRALKRLKSCQVLHSGSSGSTTWRGARKMAALVQEAEGETCRPKVQQQGLSLSKDTVSRTASFRPCFQEKSIYNCTIKVKTKQKEPPRKPNVKPLTRHTKSSQERKKKPPNQTSAGYILNNCKYGSSTAFSCIQILHIFVYSYMFQVANKNIWC